MTVGFSEIYVLLGDFACKIKDVSEIADYSLSPRGCTMSKKEIYNLLVEKSGQDFKYDLVNWSNWVSKEYHISLDQREGLILQAIKVIGRLQRIDDSPLGPR